MLRQLGAKPLPLVGAPPAGVKPPQQQQQPVLTAKMRDTLSATLESDEEPLRGGVTLEELESHMTTTFTPIQRAILRYALSSELPFPIRQTSEGRPLIVEDDDGGGLLAVGMGLGKTLAILALVLRDKLLAKKHGYPSSKPFRTLVIGAPALFSVWQAQIETHFKKGALSMVQHSESKEPEKALVHSNADIIFVTYQRIQLDMKQHLPSDALRDLLAKTSVQTLRTREAYARNAYMNQRLDHRTRLVRQPLTKRGVHSIRFWRIVIDEADALRNLRSKRLRATLALPAYNRWWMTGTPLNNSFSDIVAAMLFLRDSHVCLEQALLPDPRGLLKNIKNEHEKRARQSFERRAYVLTAQMIIEDHPELIKSDPRLKYLLAPVYMFQFADHFSSEAERIVYKRMQDELVGLLRELRNRNITEGSDAQAVTIAKPVAPPVDEDEAEINNEHILAYDNEDEMEEERVRVENEIERHKLPIRAPPAPAAKGAQPAPANNTLQAAIQSVVQSANPAFSARATINYFYLRCMQAAVMSRFADKSLIEDPNPDYYLSSTKLRMLSMWLRERVPAGDKVVVFSQWTTILRAAQEALQTIGIESVQFTGEIKEQDRAANLKRFNENSNCRVLLAQTRVGGVGQTFTAANWVFFLNPWFNPQAERQALSRIHRMGQQKTCYVVWLIICGTVEEIVRGNASGKMRRAEELMLSVDRQYPKVSEIYSQLAQLVMGRFEPRDGYRDYQRRELFREKFAYQPPMLEPPQDYALLPYQEYERLSSNTPNSNNKRPAEDSSTAPAARKVRLSLPTDKAPVMCLLTYSAYRYSGSVPRYGTFWRVAPLSEQTRSENILFDWTRACNDVHVRSIIALRDTMQPRKSANGQPPVVPTAKQAADSLKALCVPTVELYSSTQTLDRECQLTGDYNELSYISPTVLPIGKGGAAALNQSLCHRLPLDPLTVMAFLPCMNCKPFLDHQMMAYGKVHSYDVVTPESLCEDAFSPHWQLIRSGMLSHTSFTDANGRVDLTFRSHSHDDYLTYTKNLVLPVMATGSGSLMARAMLSFHWAPSPSRETKEAQALHDVLPADPHADMSVASGVVRRVYSAWHRSSGYEADRVVAIASALFLISDGKVIAAFACGVSVDESLPEHVRVTATSKLAELLVHRDIMCDMGTLYDRYKMPEISTRRGTRARPVLHLRAVSPEIVKMLSAQSDVIIKDGIHDSHKSLCNRTEVLFDTADLARQTGAYFNATAVWECFDQQ